jgi:hypothetical protein
LVEQRDRWLNAASSPQGEGLSEAEKKKRTLTNLYNTRPTWLDLSDEEILEKLLSLDLERSKANQ